MRFLPRAAESCPAREILISVAARLGVCDTFTKSRRGRDSTLHAMSKINFLMQSWILADARALRCWQRSAPFADGLDVMHRESHVKMKFVAILVTVIAGLEVVANAADQPATAAEQKQKTMGYRPSIVVYKDNHCDCCERWVKYLQANRFVVRVENVDNLGEVKRQFGIPREKDACHTGTIEGYFIEGHVPAEDIKRLIRTRPDVKGLLVPGMPIGSPGMEQGKMLQAYDVLQMDPVGELTVFAHHGK